MRRDARAPRWSVMVVRYGLPAGVALAGLVLATAGTSNAVVGAGVALVGVGMLVALLNLLMRLGLASEEDREREEQARRYFDRHGRWPRRPTDRSGR